MTESFNISGYDWYCNVCGARLNYQSGFTTEYGTWECTECGYENDVTDESIVPDDFVGTLLERIYPDGTTERVRFTKTREVHDILDALGNRKCSIWSKR